MSLQFAEKKYTKKDWSIQ